MEKEPFLIANRMKTPDGTILWSRFTHDYVAYYDANGERYILDGGNDYISCSKNKESGTNMSVYSDDKYAIIRECLLIEVLDVNGHYMWIPLSKLSDIDLDRLLDKNTFKKDDKMRKVVECEIPYRLYNNIQVANNGYFPEDAINNITKQ